MVFAKHPAARLHRPHIKRLGFRQAALLAVKLRQVVEAYNRVRMIGAKHALARFEC